MWHEADLWGERGHIIRVVFDASGYEKLYAWDDGEQEIASLASADMFLWAKYTEALKTGAEPPSPITTITVCDPESLAHAVLVAEVLASQPEASS